MSSHSDLETDRANQDAAPDPAPPTDLEPRPSAIKRLALPFILVVGIAFFIVFIVQFIPGLDSQPPVSRFRNVPPMEGPDMLKAFMPGGQQSEMVNPNEEPLAAQIELARDLNSLDSGLVPDSFQAALVLQVRQVLESPAAEPLTAMMGGGLPAELQQSFQVDPESMETLIVLIDSLPEQLVPAVPHTPSPAIESEESSDDDGSDMMAFHPYSCRCFSDEVSLSCARLFCEGDSDSGGEGEGEGTG